MRVRLYQVRENSNPNLLFRGREAFRDRFGECIPAALYRKVFDGDLAVNNPEQVFVMFNTAHPDGYTGRSMSVSDVVEFVDTGVFYFCDHCGFDRVQFLSEGIKHG